MLRDTANYVLNAVELYTWVGESWICELYINKAATKKMSNLEPNIIY